MGMLVFEAWKGECCHIKELSSLPTGSTLFKSLGSQVDGAMMGSHGAKRHHKVKGLIGKSWCSPKRGQSLMFRQQVSLFICILQTWIWDIDASSPGHTAISR